jgi:hypothetical protein
MERDRIYKRSIVLVYLFPRTYTSWSKSMAPLSLDPRFDFTTYAIQVCYIVYPYLKLHINLLRSRRKQKKEKHCYALVRIYTSLSDLRVPFEAYKVNYVFSWEKFSKLQVAKMWNWEGDFVSRTILLFNNPRKHVSKGHISHLCKECVGITLI